MSRFEELRSSVSCGALLRLAGTECRGRRWGPCLMCGADEQRGVVDVDEPLWKCHACGVGGDAVALCSWLAVGEMKPSRWVDVFRWAEDRGLLSPFDPSRPRRAVEAPPATVAVPGRLRPLPVPPEDIPPAYTDRWIAAVLAADAFEVVGVDMLDEAEEYVRARRSDAGEAAGMAMDAMIAARALDGRARADLEAAAISLRLMTMPSTEALEVPRALAFRVGVA